VYATEEELSDFCGEQIPTDKAQAALSYAKGVIDDYCNTSFEDPTEDSIYLMDGNGTASLFAPSTGPFHSISKIEYYSTEWTEYTGEFWLKHGGEVLALDMRTCPGNQNWRVTGRCWTELSEHRQSMLKKAALMIARLEVVPRDMPVGPSIRQFSAEGVSYSYQLSDQAHPTGIDEVDHILRSLRRSVVVT